MMDIQEFKRNVYSQNGEDGITEEIFKRLNIKEGYFVDIGAWDGKYLSNTYKYLEEGWSGLEIEGNRNHFKGLIDVANQYAKLNIFLRMVLPHEIDTLFDLLSVPKDFDLLSIDIDSYDYWIWEGMRKYSPKVVIIESNGMSGDYIQPPVLGYKGTKGSAVEAIITLGKVKGYKYLGQAGNLFFIKEDLWHLL
jgi:hypothetical protein